MCDIVSLFEGLDNFSKLVAMFFVLVLITNAFKLVASIFNSIFGPKVIYRDVSSEDDDE